MKFGIWTILAGAALSAAVAMGPLAAEQPTGEAPAYGPELEGFDYPFPVQHFAFSSQRQSLQMAYLDVKPDHPNGRTAVLLHGKNFCSATWEPTIRDLVAAGYRVIAPDQIGFCKSSKPAAYQFTFKELAGNTHALLAKNILTGTSADAHILRLLPAYILNEGHVDQLTDALSRISA